jgi:formyltetrahydrofolate-dependent phosphoribosylglycinamide formyltransferase
MPDRPLPIAVLISGSGRSLKNLIQRIEQGTLNATIRVVISSNLQAGGLEFARAAGIPTHIVERSKVRHDGEFSHEIFAPIVAAGVELVVMAGFIKLLPIPSEFENRVINIHPALMPNFCGKGFYGQHVHEAVIKAKSKTSGCTVHFVDNQYDHGPILLQRTVEVSSTDTPSTLADRVFAAELEALPAAIELIAAGRVKVAGRQVTISPS